MTGALEKAGAVDGTKDESTKRVVEESIYMLELPTLSERRGGGVVKASFVGEESSLAAAIDLGLRSDPCDTSGGLRRIDSIRKMLVVDDKADVASSCVGRWLAGILQDVFPPLTWCPKLNLDRVKSDVIAAATVRHRSKAESRH